jgi:NADH dehydrogenase
MVSTGDLDRVATHHMLILGGGYGGMYTALELARLLNAEDNRKLPVELTLLDRENHFLFTSMLTEVAGSDIEMQHIVTSLRRLLPRRVRFEEATVNEIDLAHKRVTVTLAGHHEQRVLEADTLVLALGSATNFFRMEGLAEHAFTMKTLHDAIVLRNRVLHLLELADAEDSADECRRLLSFVVCGGGFAGVETIAALNDFVRRAARYYPRVRQESIRMVLIHSHDRLLPELSASLARYTLRKLRERGVEVLLNTRLKGATDSEVILENGDRLPARTLVWTAGVTANPVIAKLDCQKDKHGRVLTTPSCELVDHPDVWALGDCAAIPDPRSDHPYPPTAQHAVREARVIAQNLVARWRGEPVRPFIYNRLGELALIGSRTGVARILGLNFSGVIAWFLWRSIYLYKLPNLEKKIRVALDWAIDLFFGRDIVEIPLRQTETVSIPRSTGEPRELQGAR